MKKETSSSAFILPALILYILSIHVKESFSSVFLCDERSFGFFRGFAFLCASAPQRER